MSDLNNFEREAIQQLDALIGEYSSVAARSEHDDLSDLPDESRLVATRLQAALDRLTVPDSSYRRAADAQRSEPIHVKVVELSGVAKALRADLESGWVQGITELIHADTFADLLEVADELLAKGYKDAAAVVGGTALEIHLRSLCNKHGVSARLTNGKHKQADVMNADLKKSGAYGALQQKQATAWLDIRNSAAHGHYSAYESADVERLIRDVGQFIDTHPA